MADDRGFAGFFDLLTAVPEGLRAREERLNQEAIRDAIRAPILARARELNRPENVANLYPGVPGYAQRGEGATPTAARANEFLRELGPTPPGPGGILAESSPLELLAMGMIEPQSFAQLSQFYGPAAPIQGQTPTQASLGPIQGPQAERSQGLMELLAQIPPEELANRETGARTGFGLAATLQQPQIAELFTQLPLYDRGGGGGGPAPDTPVEVFQKLSSARVNSELSLAQNLGGLAGLRDRAQSIVRQRLSPNEQRNRFAMEKKKEFQGLDFIFRTIANAEKYAAAATGNPTVDPLTTQATPQEIEAVRSRYLQRFSDDPAQAIVEIDRFINEVQRSASSVFGRGIQ